MDLKEQFPDLYFDTKTVEQKTPKATPPSLAQIFLKVLVANGINNPGIAGSLAQIASDFYKGA